MAYGIHFVSQDENPVGFWLWRIATAVHDAEEFTEEARNLPLDEESSELYRHFLRHEHWYRSKTVGMELESVSSQGAFHHAQLALQHAREVAQDKDPHDAATIATLGEIFNAVSADMNTAKAAADTAADSL